ncbi:transcription elongation factor B polypeptide 2-like [Tropilaelaps mercedesae]|uniref:Transcription elongation factor B polypeptide 2-like n=1 Tax=Tropilaelaps mercedesae TaxID=418985 RepID=A0A1V9XX76_9ACAR|nr:transcription elongation factor B polypeptide 2-like [Tropilaelaps mercedesae]
MDVFLAVRRLKTTMYLDAKESTSVRDLKRMIGTILKAQPSELNLALIDNTKLEDTHSLKEYGITSSSAGPAAPLQLFLSIGLEPISVVDYSNPPKLPDALKSEAPAPQ